MLRRINHEMEATSRLTRGWALTADAESHTCPMRYSPQPGAGGLRGGWWWSIHVFWMLRERAAAQRIVDNIFQIAGNPGSVGEDPPVGRSIELGLEVDAHSVVCSECVPICDHLRTLGKFLPIRSGSRSRGQLRDWEFSEEEHVELGDLFGGVDGCGGFQCLGLYRRDLFESHVQVLRREIGEPRPRIGKPEM